MPLHVKVKEAEKRESAQRSTMGLRLLFPLNINRLKWGSDVKERGCTLLNKLGAFTWGFLGRQNFLAASLGAKRPLTLAGK